MHMAHRGPRLFLVLGDQLHPDPHPLLSLAQQGDYVLTTKVVSLGLGFLSSAGIVDIAEPILERLAELDRIDT